MIIQFRIIFFKIGHIRVTVKHYHIPITANSLADCPLNIGLSMSLLSTSSRLGSACGWLSFTYSPIAASNAVIVTIELTYFKLTLDPRNS